MTEQDDQDHRPERQPLVHGRRTRVVVALIGLLFSFGMPVVVLGRGPVPTVDGHAVGSLVDPAGLGITGALPGDPIPGDPLPSDPVTGDSLPGSPSGVLDLVSGDSASAGQRGIPTPPNLPDGPLGIPGGVLDAYQFAERTVAALRPGCHLSWSVLAGIGRIESDHASDGRVDAFGNTLGPILGPQLDGSPGMAAIPDTDHGQLDGDPLWDRAVGPMQFIPSSWHAYGVDGNGDAVANPNNIYDSTITTGLYLCTAGTDLADPTQLQAAVFRYNHSAAYVNIVLAWARAYLTGVVPTPPAPGPIPPGINGNGGRPTMPDTTSLTAATAQPTPLTATPPTTTSNPSPPPAATTTTPLPTTTLPATTSSSPPPLSTVTLPTTSPPAPGSSSPVQPPSVTTTTAPPTELTSPPRPLPVTTTTPPAATTTNSPPPPTTTK